MIESLHSIICRPAEILERQRAARQREIANEWRTQLRASGRQLVLIPTGTQPPGVTDAEAQQYADENWVVSWERMPDGSIRHWGQM